MDEKKLRPYRVGALMYVPALRTGVGEKIRAGAYPGLNSLAFCLEDAITDGALHEAEAQLVKTLEYISMHTEVSKPLLFVRVRNEGQLKRLPEILGELSSLLTGIIFPKFDLSNAAEYCVNMEKINANRTQPLYIMPILESGAIMNTASRQRTLLGLRDLLDGYRDYVLNVRVGAMDFCKAYGLRRAIDQTIYDIGIVRAVLTDILTAFADSYVVSAPVWEYFGSANGDNAWAEGMEKELRLDLASGFIGKTVIHPTQVALVEKWLKPTAADAADARAIMNWQAGGLGVAKSVGGNRMNELATHRKWAEKILILAEIYGER